MPFAPTIVAAEAWNGVGWGGAASGSVWSELRHGRGLRNDGGMKIIMSVQLNVTHWNPIEKLPVHVDSIAGLKRCRSTMYSIA
jgi:hypothetical protein